MENIIENNKLIAEFMGIEEAYNPNGSDWILKATIPDINGETDILESCKANELKYNSSWDWLIPVVQKCIEESNEEDTLRIILEEAILSGSKYFVYSTVVEFIKWYNQIKIK